MDEDSTLTECFQVLIDKAVVERFAPLPGPMRPLGDGFNRMLKLEYQRLIQEYPKQVPDGLDALIGVLKRTGMSHSQVRFLLEAAAETDGLSQKLTVMAQFKDNCAMTFIGDSVPELVKGKTFIRKNSKWKKLG